MLGVYGAPEVDHVLDQDFLASIIDIGIERRMLLQGPAHGGHDEGKE